MNIPNQLTLFRIILIPFLVLFFYLPYTWSALTAAIIFIVASITDWLDGYLARKLNQGTSFGAFLDPVADKLIVIIALVLLIQHFASVWFTIPAMVIIGREMVISALREWMAEIGKRASVAVSYIGKVKTVLQMIAISALLVSVQSSTVHLMFIGYALLVLTVGLTLWSMVAYLRAAWPAMNDL